ncbi:metallophosphoesterase [Serinibacter salmoneus]|nr:metallophosphoesterase [Serinibacter salmoneus]
MTDAVPPGSRGSGTGRLAAATAGAVALAGAAAAWSLIEARWYTVRRARVPVLQPGSEPLRMLHISDLHLTPTQRDKVAFVRDLDSWNPDLVVNTGDNMAHRDALPTVLRAIEPLLAHPGAFVMGSNDYLAPEPKSWARYLRADPRDADAVPQSEQIDRPDLMEDPSRRLPTEHLASAMTDAGWRDLTNRRDALVVKDSHFDLVGVDDPHLDRDVFPARAPLPRGAVRLGVTHAPYQRILQAMFVDGASLVLAGHTHGGQLALPGYGALVTNCDLDTARAKGLSGWPGGRPDEPGSEDGMWLHVSAGLGTSPYAPVRFACRPEATLLDLVPSS